MSAAPSVAEERSHRKSKAATAERFRQLLDELRAVRQERDDLKKGSTTDVRRQIAEERFARQSELMRKVYTDYDRVVSAGLVPDYVLPELLQLDNAAEMAYLVAKNPALCQDLADMRPESAIRKLKAIANFVEQKTVAQLQQIRRSS